MKDIKDYRGFRDKCYQVNTTRKRWGRGRVVSAICNYHGFHEGSECPKCEKENIERAFNTSIWNEEWSYLATGQRMSKKRLKEYCKQNGKVWSNE